jgi:hypothetical protein
MWAEQVKSYNGNTIDDSYASTAHVQMKLETEVLNKTADLEKNGT